MWDGGRIGGWVRGSFKGILYIKISLVLRKATIQRISSFFKRRFCVFTISKNTMEFKLYFLDRLKFLSVKYEGFFYVFPVFYNEFCFFIVDFT